MIQTIEIFYSFQCPYSHLAMERLINIENKLDVKVLWHPFSAKAAGQPVNANSQTDRQSYLIEDAQRIAQATKSLIRFPEGWPNSEFNPEKVTKGAFVASDMGVLAEYNIKVFTRWWEDCKDPNDQSFFASLCEELDVNPNEFVGRMSSSEIRERVRGTYKRGKRLRVFDTPTVLVNEERFVGVDRIEAVVSRLSELGLSKTRLVA